MFCIMKHSDLNIVNNCLNTTIYSYLVISGGKSSNIYLNVHFLTPVLIRHLWQLKTVISLHWCIICIVPLVLNKADTLKSSSVEKLLGH
jgi:hypothetical protein